jgi:AcrR family transcriptional regulator
VTDSKLSRKEREQQRHQRDILQAAVTLFAERGYHQTTMQMVADKAEFSVGYLYKHFSGKEEMYQALLAFHIHSLDTIFAELKERGLDPLAELQATYQAVCEHFNHYRNFMRIYHEEVAAECGDLHQSKERHFQDLQDLLQRAMDAGQLQPFDAEVLAAAMHGATRELFARMAASDKEDPFSDLPDILFRIFLDPLRA